MHTEQTIAERPRRECADCAHVAQALPGAPLVCAFQGVYQRVEVARAVRGLCGVLGSMYRVKTINC